MLGEHYFCYFSIFRQGMLFVYSFVWNDWFWCFALPTFCLSFPLCSHQYAGGGIHRSLDILSLRLHFYLFILRAGFYTLRVESREDGGTFYCLHKMALFFFGSLLLEIFLSFWLLRAMTSSGTHRAHPTIKLIYWDKLGEMDMNMDDNVETDVVDNENTTTTILIRYYWHWPNGCGVRPMVMTWWRTGTMIAYR